jgi:hypothetical protein
MTAADEDRLGKVGMYGFLAAIVIVLLALYLLSFGLDAVLLAALHALASVAGVERAGETRDRSATRMSAPDDRLRKVCALTLWYCCVWFVDDHTDK